MTQGVALIRAGDAVLNVAMISAFHRDGDKLFVHYAGGRVWTFTGKQADVMWEKIAAVADDLIPAEA